MLKAKIRKRNEKMNGERKKIETNGLDLLAHVALSWRGKYSLQILLKDKVTQDMKKVSGEEEYL